MEAKAGEAGIPHTLGHPQSFLFNARKMWLGHPIFPEVRWVAQF